MVAGVGDRDQVYRVERVDGARVRLRAVGRDLSGWIPADAVVVTTADGPPADPAVRRTGARPPGGLGAAVTATVRTVRAEAALNRALAALGKKDPDGAIAACTEAIRVDPDRAEAYSLRGGAWATKDQMDRAVADLTEAIRLDPERRLGVSQSRGRLVAVERARQGHR